MGPRACIAIPCILVTLATGCTPAPAARFYALRALPTTVGMWPDLSVAVGPVSVPAVVDRPQIVVSVGPNQLHLDEFNRWAAPLQDDIQRVVAENLVGTLGTPRVTLFAHTSSATTDYRVTIEVYRFESTPGEAATLDAVWTVSRVTDAKSQTGRTTIREPTPQRGYGALAAAHSRALARLSRDISDALRVLARSEQ